MTTPDYRTALPNEPGPTLPHLPLLDPSRVRSDVLGLAGFAGPLLRELVNFGSHAHVVAREGAQELGLEEVLASFRLHLAVIEMTDAVEVLLREGCGQGAVGPARGAFEAALSLEAIHRHPDFQWASYAWLAGSLRADIKRLKDAMGLSREDERRKGMQDEIEGYADVLAKPPLDVVARVVTDERWYRPLYQVVNVHDLAGKLDDLHHGLAPVRWRDAYCYLYRMWSAALHGSDWTRVAVAHEEENRVLTPEIRNQALLAHILPFVASMALHVIRLQIQKYRPDQLMLLGEWFERKVREPYRLLLNLRVNLG